MPARPSISAVPPYRLSGFNGHPDTLRAMVEAAQGRQGEQSLLVRRMSEEIVRRVQPKDYLGEMLAIRYWVTERVRYVNDPLHVELVVAPERVLDDVLSYGTAIGDCDDLALLIGTMCLCVGRVAEFVVVGFGAPGEYSHVFARAQEPRSGAWIVLDPVAGTDEAGMLAQVTTYYTVSLDELPSQRMAA
jgi:hypothetical protein